jgi:hypothetical protein
VTPRAFRVPDGPTRRHPNGAIGVASVVIAVTDVAVSCARYDALDVAVAERDTGSTRGGGATAIVLADAARDAAASVRVRARGEGPCAVVLRTAADGAIELTEL